ncbi:integrin alpha-E-like, partial [Lampetra fluviatilis]
MVDISTALYAVGAPRHEHRGQVLLMMAETLKAGGQEAPIPLYQQLAGDQIGAYFGSELCAVDEDGDGVTDVLLVASPLYHDEWEEGRVHLYRLERSTAKFNLQGILRGRSDQTGARFGWAMSELSDTNQDGRRDLAIGAPMEDAGRGALYLFLTIDGRLPLECSQ